MKKIQKSLFGYAIPSKSQTTSNVESRHQSSQNKDVNILQSSFPESTNASIRRNELNHQQRISSLDSLNIPNIDEQQNEQRDEANDSKTNDQIKIKENKSRLNDENYFHDEIDAFKLNDQDHPQSSKADPSDSKSEERNKVKVVSSKKKHYRMNFNKKWIIQGSEVYKDWVEKVANNEKKFLIKLAMKLTIVII